MTQIAGALISIVLVLVAVFLPVAFLGGVTGTLYKQFAITISISMVISGVMALTLSPALAALIIRAHHGEKKGFFRWFENGFARLTEGYVGWVARSIRAWPVALVVYGAMLVGIFFLFRLVPSSFVPEEDQGYFFVAINAPDTASLEVVAKLTSRVEQIVSADPAVQDVASVAGYSLIDGQIQNNSAVLFVSMKPFDERKDPSLLSFAMLKRLNRQFAGIQEGFAFAINPPSIPGLGTTGGFEFYLQNRGTGDARATGRVAQAFIAKARERSELQGVSTTYRATTQQLFVDLDRNKAEVLGVTVADAFETMQAFFGSRIAGQFSQFSRVWWVVLQADANYRMNPSDFEKVYVRSKSGANVPLSALMTTRYVASPKLVTRFNGFPAVKITGTQAPGFSSGQALAAMEATARDALPADFSYAWAGQALQETGFGQHFELGLCVRPHRRLPAAGGAVREVDAAGRRGADGADRGAGGTAADLGARPRQRRLLPGRASDPGRTLGEERDPDLRVRDRARPRRHGGAGGGHRGGTDAPARDRDDLARVRLGLCAAGHRNRPWRQQPACDRHRRHRRHRRVDGDRRSVRAVLLLAAGIREPALRPQARR